MSHNEKKNQFQGNYNNEVSKKKKKYILEVSIQDDCKIIPLFVRRLMRVFSNPLGHGLAITEGQFLSAVKLI